MFQFPDSSGILALTSQLPKKTSQLTNDSGYITDSALSAVAKSGSYNDLSNKPTNLVTTDTVQKITGKKSFSNETWFTDIKVKGGDSPVNTLGLSPETLGIVELNHCINFYTTHLIIDETYDNAVTINYRDIATKSEVSETASTAASAAASAAVANQNKETWTFTLADGSTVTKSVVLG